MGGETNTPAAIEHDTEASGGAEPAEATRSTRADGADELRGDFDNAGTARLFELLLGRSARRGAAARLAALDLCELSRWRPDRVAGEVGLGPAGARALSAAFAIGRRVEEVRWARGDSIRSPAGVYRLMAPRLRGLEREVFAVVLVDGKHRLLEVEHISEGTLTTSLVHPREVFRPALRRGAAAIVAVHNHPSGDPEPSAEDVEVTRRLLDAGKLLGVPLLDHVVLGRGAFVSLRERMAF